VIFDWQLFQPLLLACCRDSWLSSTKAFPKIKLFVEEMKTADMIEALRKDRIDVGIAATPLEERGIVEKPSVP